jgi:hypothetical protein
MKEEKKKVKKDFEKCKERNSPFIFATDKLFKIRN